MGPAAKHAAELSEIKHTPPRSTELAICPRPTASFASASFVCAATPTPSAVVTTFILTITAIIRSLVSG